MTVSLRARFVTRLQEGIAMNLGMVGLGRMGSNMAQRLVRGGHRVVGYDPSQQARAQAAGVGIEPCESLTKMIAALPAQRAVWLMVPAGEVVDATLDSLTPLL